MARKNKKKKKDKAVPWHETLKPETKHSIWAIFSFTIAMLLALAYFGKAGFVGNAMQNALEVIFGRGFFLVPLMFVLTGISLLFAFRSRFVAATILGSILFLVSSLALADILFGEYTGGQVGFFASYTFMKFFDKWASLVIFAAGFFVSLLIMFNISLKFRWRNESTEQQTQSQLVFSNTQSSKVDTVEIEKDNKQETVNESEEIATENTEPFSSSQENRANTQEEIMPVLHEKASAVLFHYTPPPLDLLEGDRGKPSSGDIKANANIIKRTLVNFGIDVEMAEVSVGPSVTQYTLRPAEGIKLSRIVALQNDLALALAAHPLRIEAPIPGKSLVGIEIPNHSIALVGMKTLLSTPDFQKSSSLTFTLGRDVSGKAVYADLARMPHLLVAGATGSGKSITIHTMITSFLYKNSPEILRFLIVDPKRVELAIYNEIPHLLTPVVTDAKQTIHALHWSVKEMERRYEKLSEMGSRDIDSYNSKIRISKKENEKILPYIIIIIDELADLIAAYPREIEGHIVRLAQMSRAVGIHLVVATQRPSVEVITGLIKANITARIALQVASGVDSRTILDMSGADKLLGNGDMLYLAGDTSKPRRIQGAFITEQEIKRVVAYVAKEAQDFYAQSGSRLAGEIDLSLPLASSEISGSGEEIDDELYEEAKNLVVESQKASASYFQRRLRVGYARAARLLDLLEEQGVIGPGQGAKPRDVFIKPNRMDAELARLDTDPARQTISVAEEDDDKDEEAMHNNKPTAPKDIDTPYTNFG